MSERAFDFETTSEVCRHNLPITTCHECAGTKANDEQPIFFKNRSEYGSFTERVLATYTPIDTRLTPDERREFRDVSEIDLASMPVGSVAKIYSNQGTPQTPLDPWTVQKVSDGVLMWFVDPTNRGGIHMPKKGIILRKPQEGNKVGWIVTSTLRVGDNALFPYFNYAGDHVETPDDFWSDIIGKIQLAEKKP